MLINYKYLNLYKRRLKKQEKKLKENEIGNENLKKEIYHLRRRIVFTEKHKNRNVSKEIEMTCIKK